jgi:Zn-dependent protease with chaperone function
MRLVIAFFLLCLLLPLSALAQNPPSSPAPAASPRTTSTTGPTTAYTLPPDKLEKAKALYDLYVRLLILGTIYGLAILLGLLYLGVVARYRDWAERATQYSFIQAMIIVPLLLLTTRILRLPLAAYGHSVSRRFGLSVQSWGSWFGDQLKGEAITLIVGTIFLWLMIFTIRKSPRLWWLYLWLLALPIMVLFAVITPVIIDPIFNKFEPLDQHNPQLVDAIERVTHRGGLAIPRERMFMMKASEKVTTLNAYVTGFGPSKRVVVWDTTIQHASTPETLFVFGHEMGHYVLNHIVIGLGEAAIGLLIGLYLLYRVSGWFLRRFGERWQIRELGDWAALPMFFLIFGIMGFLATPIESALSRQLEHNADIYGLEVTHGINANSQEAAAHAFQVLGELSLDYPYPNKLLVLWYDDHPSTPDRVRFAHEYDPWRKGEAPKYVK